MVGVASRGTPARARPAGGALIAGVSGIAGAAVDALVARAPAIEVPLLRRIRLAEVTGVRVRGGLDGLEGTAGADDGVDVGVGELLKVGEVGAVLAVIRLHVDDLGPADAAVELTLGVQAGDGVPAVARGDTAVQDVLAGSAGALGGLASTADEHIHRHGGSVVVAAQQTGTVFAVVPVA